MWVYLGLLLVPLASAIASRSRPSRATAIYWLTGLGLLLAIGLRHQVGCDWNPYNYMFVRAQSAPSLAAAFAHGTWGYMLVNWLVAKAGLGFAFVNSFCALVLIVGLFAFCRIQPRPWIAFLVAVPIVLMLAGFSATRQAVALGIFLYCLSLHQRGIGLRRIVPLMLVAGSFHISGFALIPWFVVMVRKWPLSPWMIVLSAGLAGAILALVAVDLGFDSRFPVAGGAWFRFAPTILALVASRLVWTRVELSDLERQLLTWLGALALFCLGLGILPSMVMDRMNYYVVPFQMLVFARLPSLVSTRALRLSLLALVAAPFLILHVGWLAMTDSFHCMVPYRSYLTEPGRLVGPGASTDFQLRIPPELALPGKPPQTRPGEIGAAGVEPRGRR